MNVFRKTRTCYLFFFLAITTVTYAHGDRDDIFYNIKDYGAKGDGSTSDTKSINAAIAAAASSGGGTVYFPAGHFLSGAIHLESNITLYIDRGAILIAAPADASAEYDKTESAINDKFQDFGHSHFHNSLIWGENLHDISIIGSGMIWGKGLINGYKGDSEKEINMPNKAIALLSCRNVTIRDITIFKGGWFAILATGVDNLTIDNITIDTNRDGMDIDCCKNVHISNCFVNSPGDDGICLKSSFALGYARSTENVTITNCHVSGYDEGTLLDGTFKREDKNRHAPIGRIKFGTESNGGFQNIAISNCVFDYCRGLALETVDGALLEDVTITNITMRDITNSPLFIRLGARMRAPETMQPGVCRRIMISNVNIYNAYVDSTASIISGNPGLYIEDLKLSNVHIYYKGGGTKEMASVKVPGFEKNYPEPYKFGPIPAYGFFIRHVKNLEMNDVSVSFLDDDFRPPFILEDVRGATLRNIKARKMEGVPYFILDKVVDFSIRDSKGISDKQIKNSSHQSF
ncbi:MAG: glycoside hydrolase family 28 protein [Terrimonas sp.]|nr:glycoside hydrolase family 28 protein [Terrimonas sp.]